MKHDPISKLDDGPRSDPFAPGVIRLRQAEGASFRAVVGKAPVILRVDRGRKVIRRAQVTDVPEGSLALMPAGVALDVENHPASDGPYRASGLLIAVNNVPPAGPTTMTQSVDSRALAAFERALDLQPRPAVP